MAMNNRSIDDMVYDSIGQVSTTNNFDFAHVHYCVQQPQDNLIARDERGRNVVIDLVPIKLHVYEAPSPDTTYEKHGLLPMLRETPDEDIVQIDEDDA